MRGTRAAIRYAKATLAFAQEAKASDRVAEDMLAIGTLMQQNDELQIVLENPILPVAQKEAALKSLFSNACPQTIQLFRF